jgi:hypothetical protein
MVSAANYNVVIALTALVTILHKYDILRLLSLSSLAVVRYRSPTADVPLALRSRASAGLSYQLLTATAHD